MSALVGGWMPRTYLNPPQAKLDATLAGVPQFVSDVALALPQLEIEVVRQERRGNLCHVSARVKNVSSLATGLSTTGRFGDRPDGGVRLMLELPAGAKLLAGESRNDVGALAGRGLSRVVEWIVLAPQGTALELSASSAWTLATTREVRP